MAAQAVPIVSPSFPSFPPIVSDFGAVPASSDSDRLFLAEVDTGYTEPLVITALRSKRWRDPMVLALASFILGLQVLLPGFIGLANNGDFGKIAGPLSIGAPDNGAYNFLYFESGYLRAPSFYYNPRVPSSEHLLAWIASQVQQHVSNPHVFDIRWLGVLHALCWMAGFALLLRSIRFMDGAAWWIGAIAALWIFTDVSYVSYFNSFYTDAAALIGAMAMMAALPMLLASSAHWQTVAIFALAALLFVTSKGQHAIWVVVPAVILIATRRRAGYVMAAVLIAASGSVLAKSPDWYRSDSRFSTIFYRILPASPNPLADVAELGLPSADLKYVGMNAFSAASPLADPAWVRDFDRRGSFALVARFYLHHPRVAVGFLWDDLRQNGWLIRAPNLSNFRRVDGQPPGARTNRFAQWTDLRSLQLKHWPVLMILWYAAVLFGAPLLALRGPARIRPFMWSLFSAAILGCGEFCVASLTDVVETFRHLLLFHLFTDFSLWFAFQAMLNICRATGDFESKRALRVR